MISIGVDCEEVERFRKMTDDPPLLKKMFTNREIEHCLGKADPGKHLAARFCAKEAVIKALGHRKIRAGIEHIEILSDAGGAPEVRVDIEEAAGLVMQVSLSHCDSVAFAQAIVYDAE